MGSVFKGITKIFKGITDFVGGIVSGIVDFVGDVVGFVLGAFGVLDTPDVPNPGQAAQGVTLTKTGTNESIPIVYGFRRVGGALVFLETNGKTNKYLYAVYALCEGQIDGVRRVYVEDVELPNTGDTGNKYVHGKLYKVSKGKFKNRIQIQIFDGRENQSQSALAEESATWKKKERKLPGIAYAVVRYEWKEIKSQADADANPFNGGVPKIYFDLFGKKVYDVTTHGGGKDLSNTYENLSKSYSINPANCVLDYLMNPRYGAGLTVDQIDADSFKIAGDKFDESVWYTKKLYGRAITCNAVIKTEQKILDNTKVLLSGCRGIMPFVQGRYKLKVEDAGNATSIKSTTINVAYDVDSSNIIGSMSLTGEKKTSKFNKVIVNYVDPDKAFTNQQIVYEREVPGGSQTDLQFDGEPLVGEFTFHTLTNNAIANNLARFILEKSRSQRVLSFTATQELMDVEVGDIITVTDTILDLDATTFRVVGIALQPDLTLKFECVEHDAQIYPYVDTATTIISPPLFLPDDYYDIPYVEELPEYPIGLIPPNVVDPGPPTEDPPDPGGPPIDYPDDPVPPPPPEPPGFTLQGEYYGFVDYYNRNIGYGYFDQGDARTLEQAEYFAGYFILGQYENLSTIVQTNDNSQPGVDRTEFPLGWAYRRKKIIGTFQTGPEALLLERLPPGNIISDLVVTPAANYNFIMNPTVDENLGFEIWYGLEYPKYLSPPISYTYKSGMTRGFTSTNSTNFVSYNIPTTVDPFVDKFTMPNSGITVPLGPDIRVTFRYYKIVNGEKRYFEDNSDYSKSPAPAYMRNFFPYTYTDFFGDKKTGANIEAVMNYLCANEANYNPNASTGTNLRTL